MKHDEETSNVRHGFRAWSGIKRRVASLEAFVALAQVNFIA